MSRILRYATAAAFLAAALLAPLLARAQPVATVGIRASARTPTASRTPQDGSKGPVRPDGRTMPRSLPLPNGPAKDGCDPQWRARARK